MTRTLVLYHANCADGFCAAWAAYGVLGDGAEYAPAQYGEPPPDVTGRAVYILDFSYKADVLRQMIGQADSLVLLDHHKTAEAELSGIAGEFADSPKCLIRFDMGKSGARLTWDYFYGLSGMPTPWLVDYTEDRDLWLWKLPDSREISAALASIPFDFAAWNLLHDTNARIRMVVEGVAILRYQQQQVESLAKHAREIELDGHKVLCVNTPVLISEVAGKLAENRPFGMTYFETGDGKRVYSLRSREGGVDVSEVASKRGGGGHRNAAGYQEASR